MVDKKPATEWIRAAYDEDLPQEDRDRATQMAIMEMLYGLSEIAVAALPIAAGSGTSAQKEQLLLTFTRAIVNLHGPVAAAKVVASVTKGSDILSGPLTPTNTRGEA